MHWTLQCLSGIPLLELDSPLLLWRGFVTPNLRHDGTAYGYHAEVHHRFGRDRLRQHFNQETVALLWVERTLLDLTLPQVRCLDPDQRTAALLQMANALEPALFDEALQTLALVEPESLRSYLLTVWAAPMVARLQSPLLRQQVWTIAETLGTLQARQQACRALMEQSFPRS